MSVTSVEKDLEALTMTVTAEYDVTAERAWQLWADPRQLERWWGPPTYPATVEQHELTPGGTVAYFMTSPEGEKYRGWWQVLEVEPPRHLLVKDGFADAEGNPNFDLPTTVMRVGIDDRDGRRRPRDRSCRRSRRWRRWSSCSPWAWRRASRRAMGQIDAILAE